MSAGYGTRGDFTAFIEATVDTDRTGFEMQHFLDWLFDTQGGGLLRP